MDWCWLVHLLAFNVNCVAKLCQDTLYGEQVYSSDCTCCCCLNELGIPLLLRCGNTHAYLCNKSQHSICWQSCMATWLSWLHFLPVGGWKVPAGCSITLWPLTITCKSHRALRAFGLLWAGLRAVFHRTCQGRQTLPQEGLVLQQPRFWAQPIGRRRWMALLLVQRSLVHSSTRLGSQSPHHNSLHKHAESCINAKQTSCFISFRSGCVAVPALPRQGGQESSGQGNGHAGRTRAHNAHTTAIMSEPLSVLDVDAELWQVLDLCSDDELEAVYAVLHAPSPFSPVIKSLVTEREPPLVEQRGRLSLMHKIEARFRFLAADQASLLKGSRPTYRDTLLACRDRLEVPCSTNLSTFDLETEVFLHVLNNCAEYVQADEELGDPNEAAAHVSAQEGDGMTADRSSGASHWVERVTAPIMFGIKELVPTLAKWGTAFTVTEVGKRTAAELASQLVNSHVRYQAAARAAAAAAASRAAGSAAVGAWGRQAMLEGAARGLTTATARYSALQGALSFIGPVMWGWLAMDLAFKAIGPDWARVVRAVFLLAQVRLLRTNGFSNPPKVGSAAATAAAAAASSGSLVVDAQALASGEEQPPPTLLHPPYQGGYQGGSHKHQGPGGTDAGKSKGSAGGHNGTAGDNEQDDDPYANFNDIYN